MDTDALARSTVGQLFIRLMAAIMDSRVRYRFFSPTRILNGAGICPGMKVLEIGCGTGFFTIPAGQMLGDRGFMLAMDLLPESVEVVKKKVNAADLCQVVHVIKGNALDTQLEGNCFDEVILFGVIPAPVLPIAQLLGEMHRVLRADGVLSVWPSSWIHRSIIQTGWFKYINRQNGVSNYRRTEENWQAYQILQEYYC